jgi:non-ribosomal peptide synthetase component F
VPLDPGDPSERTEFMITDSESGILVSVAGMEAPGLVGVRRVNLDPILGIQGSPENLKLSLDSNSLAYVMYTSGSTGEPKGVMVPHRAITRLVLNNGYANFQKCDRVAFAANPAFDATTMEVWGPLLNGGRLVIVDQFALLEPARFAEVLKRHEINILWLTVGLYNAYASIVGEELARLRYLIIGGASDRADVAQRPRSATLDQWLWTDRSHDLRDNP